jgi:DNA-binding MarR family transcriptional regulator
VSTSRPKRAPRRAAPPAAQPVIRVGPEQELEWPGSSASATACVLNLVHVSNRIEAYGLAVIREQNVPSAAAFNVLTILQGERGPLLPSAIAERMIVTRGTVTGVLDSLERRGFIRRTSAAGGRDGRTRPVTITPRGRARVRAILPRLHQAERDWFDALSEDWKAQLLGLLAIVQREAPDREVKRSRARADRRR